MFVLPSANEKRKAGKQDYNFTFFVGFVSSYEKKNTSAVISKQDFDGSSGDEDEEGEA